MSSIHQSFCGSSKQSANCRQLKKCKGNNKFTYHSFVFSGKQKVAKFFQNWKTVQCLTGSASSKGNMSGNKSSRRERNSKFIKRTLQMTLLRSLLFLRSMSWSSTLNNRRRIMRCLREVFKTGRRQKRRHLKDRSAKITFYFNFWSFVVFLVRWLDLSDNAFVIWRCW